MSHCVSRLGLLAVVVMLGIACASERYVRDTTHIVSGYVDGLQADYAQYLRRVDSEAATRIDRLARDRQRLAIGEDSLEREVKEGKHGTLYQGLVAEAAENLKTERTLAGTAAAERAALLQQQQPLDKEPLKKLQDLSKQLLELAAPAHLKAQAKFLFDYVKAVGKAVSDLDKKARDAKTKADDAKTRE